MNAQQLKNAILQEAIEGRLVPQDPNDEPASVLLDRIRKEKAKLVKEGKLKKKDLEEKPISEDEKPFDIPESWEWVRLSLLCVRFSTGPFGTMVHKEDYVDSLGHPLVNPTNIKNGHICSDGIKMVSDNKYDELSSYVLQCNDLVLARRGDLSKIAIVSKLEEGWLAGTGAFFMHFIGGLFLPYFIQLYSTSYCQNYLLVQSVGGTMNNLNQKLLADFVIPLPPLAEQKRIVAKIEELMPKVEAYGKAQESLDKLNEELPERLKKSILQEAIEGRLVPQDPNDEPASVLLDKIRKEKARLVKEGKLKKKDLEETPISEDEKPFEIPKSWEWCRLNDICIFLSRGKSPAYSDVPTEYPVFAQKCNLKDGGISLEQARFLSVETISKWPEEYHLRTDDVLVNSTGTGTVCRTRLFHESCLGNYLFTVPDSHVSVVRTSDCIYSAFIFYLFNSKIYQDYWEDRLAGSTNQKELYIGVLQNTIIPVPPLAEQKRIVAKIEEVFKEVDKLK